MKIRLAAFAALVALAGCHNQPTAGGVSAEDERELDNAAALLDQQNVFAAPDGLGENEADDTGPQTNAAAPANASANRQ